MFLTGRFRSFSRKHGRISNLNGALERSSNTHLRGIRLAAIVTLDPNKFVEKKQECLHLGNLGSFNPRISLLKQSSLVITSPLDYDITVKKNMVPYPPDTKAFLYYSMSPERPRIAGELRLRVTPNHDPASFESGSDLLLNDGHWPWSRTLYTISKYHPPLYEKLREEQFVPDDLDRVLATFPKKKIRHSRVQILYTLNDTFIIDFSIIAPHFFAITEQGMERLLFNNLFFDGRDMYMSTPYRGIALARFERSTLPEHNGTRTVVLRFLKIITPVECVIPHYDDHVCCPKEGELHQDTPEESARMDQNHPVWGFNIDIPSTKTRILRGLQLLWDA